MKKNNNNFPYDYTQTTSIDNDINIYTQIRNKTILPINDPESIFETQQNAYKEISIKTKKDL
jgi:hypothetical protein